MSIEENRFARLNDALNYIRNVIIYYRNLVERRENLILERNAVMEISQNFQISIIGSNYKKNSKGNSSYNFLVIKQVDSISFSSLFTGDKNLGINRSPEKNYLCKKRARGFGSFNKLEIENIANRVFSGNQENSNMDIITTINSEENNNRGIFINNNSDENSILTRIDYPGKIISTNCKINLNRDIIDPNNNDKIQDLNNKISMNIISGFCPEKNSDFIDLKNYGPKIISPVSSNLKSMVELGRNIPPKKFAEDKKRKNMDNNSKEKKIKFKFPSKKKGKKKLKKNTEKMEVFKVHDSSSETFFLLNDSNDSERGKENEKAGREESDIDEEYGNEEREDDENGSNGGIGGEFRPENIEKKILDDRMVIYEVNGVRVEEREFFFNFIPGWVRERDCGDWIDLVNQYLREKEKN